MKFAVSVYSFMQYLADGRLTPLTCISKAKELGFDAIEFVDFVFPKETDPAEYAKQVRAESDRIGLPISNFAVGADFLNGSGGDLEAEATQVKKKVDLAAILGCPVLRHDVTRGPEPRTWQGYNNVVGRLAEGCRIVTEYAKEKGIKTMTENHGYFSQDSLRVESLINTVADENFGQLVDIGNFLCADDDPAQAVGRCAPYAFYVHAKDFIIKDGNSPDPGEGFFPSRSGNYLRGTIIGHGNVPILHCLRALRNINYDGYIAIEFEGIEDSLQALSISLANLKKYTTEACKV